MSKARSFPFQTPLDQAIKQGDAEIVRKLILQGVAISDKNRKSPLSFYERFGSHEVKVTRTVQEVLDVLLQDAIKGKLESHIKFLIKQGANVNSQVPRSQDACLHLHIANIKIARDDANRSISERRRKINQNIQKCKNAKYCEDKIEFIKENKNINILIASTEKEIEKQKVIDLNILNLLINENADLNAQGRVSRTPLHLAALFGLDNIAKLLLDTGRVDLDKLDNQKSTPLHLAASYGHLGVCQLLKDYGANLTLTDEEDKKAHELVQKNSPLEDLLKPVKSVPTLITTPNKTPTIPMLSIPTTSRVSPPSSFRESITPRESIAHYKRPRSYAVPSPRPTAAEDRTASLNRGEDSKSREVSSVRR
jgi:ankyrin repeat protein